MRNDQLMEKIPCSIKEQPRKGFCCTPNGKITAQFKRMQSMHGRTPGA